MNMKKQLLARGIIGALAGLAIGQMVMIVISLCVGDGMVLPVPPQLALQAGSELAAYILQTLAVMLYGGCWAAASCIWQVERWSLLRQTVLHFALSSLSALPIAWLLCWFPHTWAGCAAYFLYFLLLYACIWAGNYLSVRARVRAMNKRLAR